MTATKETPLTVLGPPGDGFTALPVSGGIPFPQGELKSARRLAVFGSGGRRLSSQADALVRWEDGSVKVALVTVDGASPGEGLTLSWARRPPDPPAAREAGIRIRKAKTRRGRRFTVDTGAARFVFAAEPTPVLRQIHSGRRAVLAGPLALSLQTLAFAWYDAAGPGSMRVESSGPLRAVVRLAGGYRSRDRNQRGLKWIMRVEMWAGHAAARLQHTLVDDDPRSMVRLRNVGLSLPTRQRPDRYTFGGEAGSDGLHAGRIGPADARGACLYQAGLPGSCETAGVEPRYAVLPGEAEGAVQAEGARAAGWARAAGIGVFVKHFWQQFPKEIAVTPSGVDVWLHTDRSGEYLWSEVPGLAKTHELLLHAGECDDPKAAGFLDSDAILAATPRWYLGSGVFGHLAPPDAASAGYDERIEFSFDRLRWSTFGWKHFGDKPSGQSAGPRPGASYGNHHYEEPRTFIHQFLRTGAHRWFREGAAGARHFMDIDVQHSPGPNRYADGSDARPNPGPGFVWMHYSHDHQGLGHVSHFHLGGLGQYYLLTGDGRALEVLREIASHAASLIEDPPPTFSCETLSEGALERSGPRAQKGYWGQTRDQGWLVHLMHQAYLATGDERFPGAAAKVVRSLIRQWRAPTPHLRRGKEIGTLAPPDGCWGFHWREGDKVCTGLQGWGSAIVLMSVVEFFADNERLGLLPRRTLIEMMHQNARHMARHIWDPEKRAFRYVEFGEVRPGRYWPNSIFLFPVMAVANITGDGELARICRETYSGPLGIEACGRRGDFDSTIGMWLTPHYLASARDWSARP